jgi:hypothetical protein
MQRWLRNNPGITFSIAIFAVLTMPQRSFVADMRMPPTLLIA